MFGELVQVRVGFVFPAHMFGEPELVREARPVLQHPRFVSGHDDPEPGVETDLAQRRGVQLVEDMKRLPVPPSIIHKNLPRGLLRTGHGADGVAGVVDPLALARMDAADMKTSHDVAEDTLARVLGRPEPVLWTHPSFSMLIMSKLTTSNTFIAWSSPTEQKSAPSALTAMHSITPEETRTALEFPPQQLELNGTDPPPTQVTPEVFHKLNSFVLLLLPEFDMTVLTGGDEEVCPRTETWCLLTENEKTKQNKKQHVCHQMKVQIYYCLT